MSFNSQVDLQPQQKYNQDDKKKMIEQLLCQLVNGQDNWASE